MRPAPVIGAGDGREGLSGQVGGGPLAPGEHAEPGRGDVREQGRGPAAPVKAHRYPPPCAHDLAQVRQQAAQLPGQRVRRLGDHHEHRIAVLIGDPGLHRRGGGELQPRHVCLLHLPGPVVHAGVPVHVQEPQRVRPGGGVAAGQHHHQLRGLARSGQLAELAADRLDLRRPVQPEHPAQRRRRHPGGALGPRLPGQRQEHQRQQRRGQPVKSVPELAVHLSRGIQQAAALQRRQRQQQPGQRIPRARSEHRDSALPQQPPPGQHPLPVPRHRIRQHRNRRARALLTVPGVQARAVFGGAGHRVLPCGRHPPERVAHAERRHPGRRGDLPQGRPCRVQLRDPRCQLRGQLRGPLRAPPGRHQPGHPARGQRLIPPPDRARVHPERLRHLALGAARSRTSCTAASRRPASSPASQAKVARPCTVTSPLPSSPAARPTPGAISAAPSGSSGRGSWLSMRAIIHSSRRPCHCTNFLTERGGRSPATPRKTRKNRNKSRSGQDRALVTPSQQVAMSGALDPGFRPDIGTSACLGSFLISLCGSR